MATLRNQTLSFVLLARFIQHDNCIQKYYDRETACPSNIQPATVHCTGFVLCANSRKDKTKSRRSPDFVFYFTSRFWPMSHVVMGRAVWRGAVGLFSAMNLVNKAKKRANKKCRTTTHSQGAVHAVLPRDSLNCSALCARKRQLASAEMSST
jgi:hypothetical protein